MFDMSWSELLLIAVVALIVIGPKDLPRVVKTFAQFARKARGLAREFQAGVEEMSREAELDSLKTDIEAAAGTDFGEDLENTIDPGGTVAKQLEHKEVAPETLERQGADAAATPAPEIHPTTDPASHPAPVEATAPAAPTSPSVEPAQAPVASPRIEPARAEPVSAEPAKG